MSYPPPLRRSRSRSPRGSYQTRSIYDYPPEPGIRDWENLEKDRWAYERPYDYGRRPRSRSPEDFTRKRRRSPSPPYDRPYERERYDPRPRYNDDPDHRNFGYSPPGRGHGQQLSSRRPPPDPHTLEYPANLRQYAEWFRFYYPGEAAREDNADKTAEQEAGDGSKPRNGIKSRWEKYKKDFAATQLQTMFEHHKKSPWFWEKYDPSPEFQKLRQRVRKEGWKGRLNVFLFDLESGKFDPDLNESESDSTGNKDHTNGEAASTDVDEVKPAADDDQFDAEDDGGAEANGKLGVDTRRPNKGEEIAIPPEGNQVMIRTIPPDIGRLKLEESCKIIPGYIYLALGDPLQKRNYYRAGWLRFMDDADMTMVMSELQDRKIEGFKLHVSHTTKPFVNKIRIAPDVASKPDRMEKDLAKARILAGLLEEEAAVLRKIKPGRDDALPKPEGEDTLMDSNNTDNGDGDLDGEEDEEEPPERGSDAVDRRIEKILADMRDQGLVDPGDEEAYEAKKTQISLDLYLAYLRAAYHACYYCSVVTDHLEELQRKCIRHVRKPLSKASTVSDEAKVPNRGDGADDEEKPATEKESPKKDARAKNDRGDDRWLDWLDQKIALLINRDGVDPRDYGGKSFDEELSKLVEPHIKQEDEGKFRCRNCQKLFKATSFVEKHIANKHPELVKPLEDIPYFNNFALDPHRIQPFAHPPATIGNSAQAPPQAYGIQTPMNTFSDYGRMPYSYPSYPPPPPGNGYWGEYGPGKSLYEHPSQRRDDPSGRRLSDRIAGFADIAGLPPKPPAAMDGPLSAGNGNNNNRRRNTGGQASGGPPPPPPPDAKEDPRAAAGRRVSYHDMDLVAEGDVELTY